MLNTVDMVSDEASRAFVHLLGCACICGASATTGSCRARLHGCSCRTRSASLKSVGMLGLQTSCTCAGLNVPRLLQGRNSFTGSLPALSRLAQCEELSLDNNQLTQTIPADWWQMPALQVLDLAFNNLR